MNISTILWYMEYVQNSEYYHELTENLSESVVGLLNWIIYENERQLMRVNECAFAPLLGKMDRDIERKRN